MLLLGISQTPQISPLEPHGVPQQVVRGSPDESSYLCGYSSGRKHQARSHPPILWPPAQRDLWESERTTLKESNTGPSTTLLTVSTELKGKGKTLPGCFWALKTRTTMVMFLVWWEKDTGDGTRDSKVELLCTVVYYSP